eukprot:Opistho-2@47794
MGSDDDSDSGDDSHSSSALSDSDDHSSVTSAVTSSSTAQSTTSATSNAESRHHRHRKADADLEGSSTLLTVSGGNTHKGLQRRQAQGDGGTRTSSPSVLLGQQRAPTLSQYFQETTPQYIPKRKFPESNHDRTRFLIWSHRTTAPPGYMTRSQRAKDQKLDTDGEQILRLRIDARKKAIAQGRQRTAELKDDNITLKNLVERFDADCINSVNGILDRNVKIHGALGILGRNFSLQLDRAKQIAAKDVAEAERLYLEVQAEHDRIKALAEERKEESIDVAAYKNDGYPRLQAQIRDLEKMIEQLKVEQAAQVEELLEDFARDGKAAEAFVDSIQQGIAAKVTEHALDLMDRDTRELAMENMMMRREMAAHKEALAQLESDISAAENANRKIALENRANVDPRRRVLAKMQRDRPSIEHLFDDTVL